MKNILTLILTVILISNVFSQTSFEEIFDLNLGSLNPQNGWSGNTSFQVVSDNMSLTNYFFTNNEEKVVRIQSSGGTISRDNAIANPLITGSAYLSFLAKIEDKNNLRDSEDYQVGIGKLIFNTSFAGVGFYRDEVNGGVIKAALQTNNSSNWVNSSETFSENTVYHIVLKYKFKPLANDSLFVFISDGFMGNEPAVSTLATEVSGTGLLDNIGSVILNSHPGSSNVLLVDGLQLGSEWNGYTTLPLPIELVEFSGRKRDEATVELNWMTSLEINNDFFTIEKSRDGVNFLEIGKLNGQGESTSNSYYDFLDEDPFAGNNYYRLKQTDFDGKYTYSEIIVIEIKNKKMNINVFPNPTFDFINIKKSSSEVGEAATVKILNANGQIAYQQDLEGGSLLQIPVQDWSCGWYVVQVEFQRGETFSQKLFVQ